jgi:hypothetical protein
MLSTLDAHGLYTRYGFRRLQFPEHYLAANSPQANPT